METGTHRLGDDAGAGGREEGSAHPSWPRSGWVDRGDGGQWTAPDDSPPRAPLLERPVLVTAFGPFPGQPVNPSELVVDALAGEEDVVSHVLDVSYDRAPDQLDGLVRMVDPTAVVCFGVAASTTGVRVETTARNLDDSPAADVDGAVREGRRIDHGPATVPCRLDVDSILAALGRAGIPATRSDDAGGYVCNHVLRHAVMSSDLYDRPVGFVHVPRLGAPGFAVDTYGLVGRTVVADVVQRLLADGQGD